MAHFPEFTASTINLLEKFCALAKFQATSLMASEFSIIIEVLKVHSKILSDEIVKRNECFNKIAACQDLAELLDTAIRLSIDKNQPISFLATQPIELSHTINTLKHKAWKILNRIMEVTLKEDIMNLPAYGICASIIEDAIGFVINLCKHYYTAENGLEISEDPKRILLDIITFIKEAICIKEFKKIFIAAKEQLVLSLIFPLLRATKEEYEGMLKDADNFVNLAADTCDDHNSKIIKTEAAALLENICEEIDGTLTFVFDFSITLIQNACSSLSNNASFFASITPPAFLLDAAFTALAIVSYLTGKRPDLR